jgi:hypothetical protein
MRGGGLRSRTPPEMGGERELRQIRTGRSISQRGGRPSIEAVAFGSRLAEQMCCPNSIHPDASKELADIKAAGNVSQRVLAAAAWAEALAACRAGSIPKTKLASTVQKYDAATQQSYFARVYEFKLELISVFGHVTEGVAIAAIYQEGHNACMDVLACDVTHKSYWHGPDYPIVRACKRIP